MNQFTIGIVISFLIIYFSIKKAFSLPPKPLSTFWCPFLISSSIWGSVGYIASVLYSVEHYGNMQEVTLSLRKDLTLSVALYIVHYITGILFGVQMSKNLSFSKKFCRDAKSAFKLVLPLSVILGMCFFGVVSSLICSYVLKALDIPFKTGEAVVLSGLYVGSISTIISYAWWRICIKKVWR